MKGPDLRATDGLRRVRPDVEPLTLLLHAAMCGSCRTLGPHGAHVAQAPTQGSDADDPRVVAAFRRYAPSTTTYRLSLHREGVPSPDPWRSSPEHAAGLVVPEARRDPKRDMTHPIAHGDVVLFLNTDRATPADTARTLLHELAHVLLGHLLPYLRAPHRAAVPARFALPTSVIEIEAILATLAAARRRGYGGSPLPELNHWLQRAQEDDALQLVDLIRRACSRSPSGSSPGAAPGPSATPCRPMRGHGRRGRRPRRRHRRSSATPGLRRTSGRTRWRAACGSRNRPEGRRHIA